MPGLFDQPFGDWYEAQSAVWVNRFVTAPLLYGVEAVVPPTELGLQLRGGLQWGALGQDGLYDLGRRSDPGSIRLCPSRWSARPSTQLTTFR